MLHRIQRLRIAAGLATLCVLYPAAAQVYVPNKPQDVDRLPSGNILVTDAGDLHVPGTSGVYEIDRGGNIVRWFAPSTGAGVLDWAHDTDVLPNGDWVIADTENDRVIIVTPAIPPAGPGPGSIVWDSSMTPATPLTLDYPNDVDPLSFGPLHLLITVRDQHRAIEVDPNGAISWSYAPGVAPVADCNTPALFGPHNADRLASGNTIVCDSLNDRVLELDPNGDIVWCYNTLLDWPRDADRLASGNTLINDSNHQRLIEVTPAGAVVWEFQVGDQSYDSDRLNNGDTLISLGSRIIEVDSCGRIVWEYPASTMPDVIWQTEVEGVVFACPVVGPDRNLYFATHVSGGVLYKIDPCRGEILDFAYAPGFVENALMMAGDGMLYVPTGFASSLAGPPRPVGPYTLAYRPELLNEVWRTAMIGGSDNSPILGSNDRVYIGVVIDPRAGASGPCVGDGLEVTSCAAFPCFGCCGKFYSFDAQTGDTRISMDIQGWQPTPGVVDELGRVFFGIEDIAGETPVWCPPGSEVWPGRFYAIDGADPNEPNQPTTLWEFAAPGGDYGSPTGYADGTVYSTCRDGHLRGWNPATGTVVFDRWLGATSWSGVTIGRNASGNAVLYAGTQGLATLDLVDPNDPNDPNDPLPGLFWAVEVDGTFDGNLLWATDIGGMSFGNAALDNLGYLYVTSESAVLYALDTSDGSVVWTYALPGGYGGNDGPTILDDGTLVVTSSEPPAGPNTPVTGYVTALRGLGDHLADDAPWPKYKHDLRNTSNVLTPIRDIRGDLDGSGCVDLDDLTGLLQNFGGPGAYWIGDITGDGVVNLDDLTTLLQNFGHGCP